MKTMDNNDQKPMESAQISDEKKDINTEQLIVFKLGMEEYCLHINQIKEIVKTPAITRMPQTPDYIKGVANIRGNIIAMADLEKKFDLQKNSEDEENSDNFTLVIASDEFKLGVLVNEVPSTLSVPKSAIDEASNLAQDNTNSGYIKGIVKLEDRLIILIDIFHVLSEMEVNQIFKATA